MQAQFEGDEADLYIRVGEHNGIIYLDLADDHNRAVKLAPGKPWVVVSDPPVRFRRPPGMLPLPVPIAGGSLDTLRGLINVRSERNWILLASWLVGTLRVQGPHPLLFIVGQQGSAKSFLTKTLRYLIDPHQAQALSEPKNVQDLMVTAGGHWVMPFDNVSKIRPWLSDTFCQIATGISLSKRKLYTDDGESVLTACRPVIINSIDEVISRGDLLDRTLQIELCQIEEATRRDEAALRGEIERLRPIILGALLDAASGAMARMPLIPTSGLPRMVDFARFAIAAEPHIGVPAGSFLTAYRGMALDAAWHIIECDPLAAAIHDLMAQGGEFHGTVSELLVGLEDYRVDPKSKKLRQLPASPESLGHRLRRIMPNLKRVGIEIVIEPRTKCHRLIRIRMHGGDPAAESQRLDPLAGDDRGDSDDSFVGTITPYTEGAKSLEFISPILEGDTR